jgi:hypothetical protein
MNRFIWSVLLGVSLVSVGCTSRQSDDPAARERELQKRAQEQHEAEEKAAREKGTDNATAIKQYQGPQTKPNKAQPKRTNTTKGETQK